MGNSFYVKKKKKNLILAFRKHSEKLEERIEACSKYLNNSRVG